MPNYSYIAKSFDGQTEKGVLNAKDEHQLSQNLKSRGFVLVNVTLSENNRALKSYNFSSFLGVSLSEKIMMAKNLGVMISAGLSLLKSFDILAGQARSNKMKNVLLDIKDRINKGENLSDGLSRYPKIFSDLFINMIKVGEESGTLEEVLSILTLQLSKEYELKSKIRNAMIYPAIILMVMLVVGGVIVTLVLPNLNIFFTSLNVDIPIYTRILLWVGNFLSQHWYVLFLAPIFIIIFFIIILKTASGKRTLDTVLLRLPIISPVVRKSNSASLIRSLSSLIASGVPLTRSLEISAKTVGNHYFREAALEAEERIKKGEKLAEAFKYHHDIFPFGVIEMIEVGEETGKTSMVLKKLADFYEQEAVSSIEALSVLIEPMLIVFLGVVVGFFAFSVIQPMYSSLSGIQ